MEDISVPIDVKSNGEEVAEIDSRQATKTSTIHTGLYKPVADGKPLKRRRKLTSTVWEYYDFLEPDQDGNCLLSVRNVGNFTLGKVNMALET